MTRVSVNELLSLKGQVAVVTGAAAGIGEAIASRLVEAGASVLLTDLNERLLTETAARLSSGGGRARAHPGDVADPQEGERAIRAAVEAFGRVDVLVNNAGIFPFSPALTLPPSLWDKVFAVNLRGAFFHAQAFAREIQAEKHGGTVVNISSVDAFHPTGALAHYDATKAGLAMLTRSLAVEFAPLGIRVNAIAPGSINTPGAQAATATQGLSTAEAEEAGKAFMMRIPLRRMGEPDEVARAVLFLASGASSYVTGGLIVVDGGYLVG